MNALLEIVGTIPNCMTDRYVKELPWLRNLLISTKVDIRNLAAQIHAIIVAHGCADTKELETRATEFLSAANHRVLENQHGALIALAWMLERTLTLRRETEDKQTLLKWPTYASAVETLRTYATTRHARQSKIVFDENLEILSLALEQKFLRCRFFSYEHYGTVGRSRCSRYRTFGKNICSSHTRRRNRSSSQQEINSRNPFLHHRQR